MEREEDSRENPQPAIIGPRFWYRTFRAEGIPKRKSAIGAILFCFIAPTIVTVERKAKMREHEVE